MKAAIITISDKGYKGERLDTSGAYIKEFLMARGIMPVSVIVPDEVALISEELKKFISSGVDFIITTGGTGFTERDVTPEATALVLEKELPGIAETMRAIGREHKSSAVLSRALAGTAGKTFIVNFPGSLNAVKDYLPYVFELVPHIIDLLHGKTEHHEK